MDNKQRLQKLIAQVGLCSRRQAEQMIKDGKVYLNGEKANLGDRASWEDKIEIDGEQIAKKVKIVWYLLNKPAGYITTVRDQFNRPTVMDFFDNKTHLFPVGRLDYNTTGLLLITNDGELANKLLHPRNKIERIYLAKLDYSLADWELDFLNTTSLNLDGVISKQKIEKVSSRKYKITIWQGSNHHVKKIFAIAKKQVIELKRIGFANLELANLPEGQFRKLSDLEIKKLTLLV
ncbi:ribosomal large subunit pseudouridine synthase B [Mesomycoplasma conjunctivae]|uniref:Pseudouridine synthase n=1 Tax=Mesomycoplasma conjunctivae (strain ATCC 25834 / NCTC 10147 / HRC/581) TaxID=572263 RepID=C5J686_MESCH|nr:pseudouridine synthase [Mesomycoplasma conjunctivae]CAT04978.1 Pseudouridine synthase [Mesomycoplasma conjunctivae]VEU66146.1 ribosomal large subunit pseudouridine synthase B [Mesomycoplasma conjunctivae]